jgi:hypothetical protein
MTENLIICGILSSAGLPRLLNQRGHFFRRVWAVAFTSFIRDFLISDQEMVQIISSGPSRSASSKSTSPLRNNGLLYLRPWFSSTAIFKR